MDITLADRSYRMRIAVNNLADPSGETIGRVVLLREISHEPLRRRFDDVVTQVIEATGSLRPVLEEARSGLQALGKEVSGLHIDSPGLGHLEERLSRTVTAIDSWLDVDQALASEDYPDAQLLQDRMRVALARWPLPDQIPGRVGELGRKVEEYYESGENPKQPVL